MEYELTNSVMEDRARMGLSVWVCRYLHKDDHEVESSSYDSRWRITSRDMRCGKCGRRWKDLSPLMNLFHKTLVECVVPAVRELLEQEDPIYSLLKESGKWRT